MQVPAKRTVPMVAEIGHSISVESTQQRGGSMGGSVRYANQVFALQAPAQQQVTAYPPQTYQPQTRLPELNRKVLEYAQSKVGTHVRHYPLGTFATPQCTELAEAALQSAGAQGGNGSLAWGREVSLHELKPGDILQMFNAEFYSGQWGSQHTAVVTRVEGSKIYVLEQNMTNPQYSRGGSPVVAGSYDASQLKFGSMRYYRPQARSNGGGYQQGGYGQMGFPQGGYGNPGGFVQNPNVSPLGVLIGTLIRELD